MRTRQCAERASRALRVVVCKSLGLIMRTRLWFQRHSAVRPRVLRAALSPSGRWLFPRRTPSASASSSPQRNSAIQSTTQRLLALSRQMSATSGSPTRPVIPVYLGECDPDRLTVLQRRRSERRKAALHHQWQTADQALRVPAMMV